MENQFTVPSPWKNTIKIANSFFLSNEIAIHPANDVIHTQKEKAHFTNCRFHEFLSMLEFFGRKNTAAVLHKMHIFSGFVYAVGIFTGSSF